MRLRGFTRLSKLYAHPKVSLYFRHTNQRTPQHKSNPGVESTFCKEKNQVASKLGALLIMKDLLNLPIDADSIPQQGDYEGTDEAHQTIVAAEFVRPVEDVEVESA